MFLEVLHLIRNESEGAAGDSFTCCTFDRSPATQLPPPSDRYLSKKPDFGQGEVIKNRIRTA